MEPTVRKAFADTAYWAAAVTTNSRGEARISLEMPENLTTWRVRAWGMGLPPTLETATACVRQLDIDEPFLAADDPKGAKGSLETGGKEGFHSQSLQDEAGIRRENVSPLSPNPDVSIPSPNDRPGPRPVPIPLGGSRAA